MKNQRFSTKSPNTSLSQDLLSCEKKGFSRNIQTQAFHETLQSCKKNPAIFKHISSKTRGFHEFKFLVSETPDTKSPNTSRFPRFYRERESFPYWCPNNSVFCGWRMGLNRKIKQIKNSSQLVQFVLNRNLFVLVKWHIWNYTCTVRFEPKFICFS